MNDTQVKLIAVLTVPVLIGGYFIINEVGTQINHNLAIRLRAKMLLKLAEMENLSTESKNEYAESMSDLNPKKTPTR